MKKLFLIVSLVVVSLAVPAQQVSSRAKAMRMMTYAKPEYMIKDIKVFTDTMTVFSLADQVIYPIGKHENVEQYITESQLQWYHPLIFVLIHLVVWALSLYPVHKIIPSYKLCVPGCFYLSTLFMVVLFSFFVAGVANERMLMVAIGATIFLSSDIYLVKCNFYKHSKREDFFIMLLYLIGQGLIVYGLLYSGGALGA